MSLPRPRVNTAAPSQRALVPRTGGWTRFARVVCPRDAPSASHHHAPPRLSGAMSTPAKRVVVGRVAQVIGAVVDVEFDDVEDVPGILNALTIKVNIEKYNKKNDQTRTASLLPKQVRDHFSRTRVLPYGPRPRPLPRDLEDPRGQGTPCQAR